ncbi:hypothetical protein PIB30_074638, partial [Stylosanthes scabra]|nr:hypothetical protein [Stylosanthes scabra]
SPSSRRPQSSLMDCMLCFSHSIHTSIGYGSMQFYSMHLQFGVFPATLLRDGYGSGKQRWCRQWWNNGGG